MQINITQEDNITILALTDRLDAVSAVQFEERINAWLEQNELRLVLNLKALSYISSAGLRVILSTAKKMKSRDGKLCLTQLQSGVKEVFDISGFSTIIPLTDNLAAALDKVR